MNQTLVFASICVLLMIMLSMLTVAYYYAEKKILSQERHIAILERDIRKISPGLNLDYYCQFCGNYIGGTSRSNHKDNCSWWILHKEKHENK